MRSARSEHILVAAALAVPLALVFLGWPAFVRWAAGPSPDATPEIASASPTSTGLVREPTRHPTVGAPPTIASRTTSRPAASDAATPIPAAAAGSDEPASVADATPVVHADDPSAAVQDFYARVAVHDFIGAAALWSPRMRAAFPPEQNIDERFSGTRMVSVRQADVVAQTGDRAAVAIDVDEAAVDGEHHWSGTWHVVRGPDGWLLDQPDLKGT